MTTPLRVLLIEDDDNDAELLRRELVAGAFVPYVVRVDTPEAMASALKAAEWDVVVSDYSMPRFSGIAALRLLQQHGLDLPFIVVSGTIGEDVAVEAMRSGAHDYVMKGNLRRLVPAVRRELKELEVRAARRRSEETLRALQKAVETLPIGVTIADVEGRIVYTNPAEAALHGYDVAELVGREARMFMDPQYWNPVRLDQIGTLSAWKRERPNLRKDGSSFPAYLISDAVRSPSGEPIGLVTVCEDITERKRTEEQLLRNAFYDTLTNLPNRSLFLDRLRQALERARRRGDHSYAVFVLDVDRFKVVNDSLGHGAGDELLVRIARRIEACLRPGDTVARLGGDEFAVLVEDVSDLREAVAVAEHVHRGLRDSLALGGHEVFCTVSTGIALGTPGYEPEEMLRDADTAMYRAKASGRGSHAVFQAAMHERARSVLEMETELRRGLQEDQFVLHYQPIVRLEDGTTAGYEALVRWNHPQRGLLQPGEFIPFAEDNGLITLLGSWTLRQACADARGWPRTGRESWVAVNVSAQQFRHRDLAERIADVLAATGLPASRLEVELTESAVMDDVKSSILVLEELKALGVRISIDDFGTGYSSLSYLKLFPVDTLKVDRSFVSQIASDPRDAAIVGSVIALAHSLGLAVVAEGVETKEQLGFLRGHGCDLAQGYLLGRPVPAIASVP